jgi:hypothetical protein
MAIPVEEILARLPDEERTEIEARTAELIREERSLRALRLAARKTQKELARKLGVEQSHISRLEQRSDMYLSTLRAYVKVMGGELDLVVRLPGEMPVHLTSIGDIAPAPRTKEPA